MKLRPEIITYIHQILYADAHVTHKMIKTSIQERFETTISLATISRGCAMLNYKYKLPKHKQMLTPKQIADRVSFAYTLITMYYSAEINLHDIIFSDESRFVLCDDRRWVWRRHGEDNITAYRETRKFPSSLMIYGAIGVDYKSK